MHQIWLLYFVIQADDWVEWGNFSYAWNYKTDIKCQNASRKVYLSAQDSPLCDLAWKVKGHHNNSIQN